MIIVLKNEKKKQKTSKLYKIRVFVVNVAR